MNRFCPIKDNYRIFAELESRWLALGLRKADIVADAALLNVTIDYHCLSRWANSFDDEGKVKDYSKGRLGAEGILWLCTRWGVDVKVNVTPAKNRSNERELIARAKKFDVTDIF